MRLRLPLALIVALLSACTVGDGGAINVRWRFADGATGGLSTSCDVIDPQNDIDLHVDTMHLLVRDATSGTAIECTSCTFPCAALERTTEFEIPAADYYIALSALACGAPVGDSPPEVLRTVHRGQITNLNAIQITIRPGTHTPSGCAP